MKKFSTYQGFFNAMPINNMQKNTDNNNDQNNFNLNFDNNNVQPEMAKEVPLEPIQEYNKSEQEQFMPPPLTIKALNYLKAKSLHEQRVADIINKKN